MTRLNEDASAPADRSPPKTFCAVRSRVGHIDRRVDTGPAVFDQETFVSPQLLAPINLAGARGASRYVSYSGQSPIAADEANFPRVAGTKKRRYGALLHVLDRPSCRGSLIAWGHRPEMLHESARSIRADQFFRIPRNCMSLPKAVARPGTWPSPSPYAGRQDPVASKTAPGVSTGRDGSPASCRTSSVALESNGSPLGKLISPI